MEDEINSLAFGEWQEVGNASFHYKVATYDNILGQTAAKQE